jgi:hypothetical protein
MSECHSMEAIGGQKDSCKCLFLECITPERYFLVVYLGRTMILTGNGAWTSGYSKGWIGLTMQVLPYWLVNSPEKHFAHLCVSTHTHKHTLTQAHKHTQAWMHTYLSLLFLNPRHIYLYFFPNFYHFLAWSIMVICYFLLICVEIL